jgi:hypothetical protein
VNPAVPVRADRKLITCVTHRPLGGLDLIRELHRRGVNATALWHARGSGIGDPPDHRGRIASFEKEVLVAVVPASESEETFAFLYDAAGIGEPGGGLLFMETLDLATDFILPPLAEENPAG